MSTAEQPVFQSPTYPHVQASPEIVRVAERQGEPAPAAVSTQTAVPEPQTRELDAAAMTTWAKLRDVQARIKELGEQEDALKATLREHLGVGEYAVGGQVLFTISPQRRFDQTLAAAELTDAERAACTRTVLDRDAVQKLVSPARYAAMQAEHGVAKVNATRSRS